MPRWNRPSGTPGFFPGVLTLIGYTAVILRWMVGTGDTVQAYYSMFSGADQSHAAWSFNQFVAKIGDNMSCLPQGPLALGQFIIRVDHHPT